MKLILYFDGSAWPNPGGTAKYGWTLTDPMFPKATGNGFAGEGPSVSNNYAEFFAMAEGLDYALTHRARPGDVIEVIGDSEIAIKLMQGKYKANKEKLYWPQYSRCMDILQVYYRHNIDVEFKWVPREKNQECDELSKLPATKPADSTLLAEAEDILL